MTYARFRAVLVSTCLLLVGQAAAPAAAGADEFDLDEDQGYPMELVRRPLVLRSGMAEFRIGGMSDFLAASSVKADAVRTRLDAIYAPFTRGQIGLETDMDVVGDASFQVRDASAWAEYNVHPTMSLRFGGYLVKPHDVDAIYGVRVGAPMKWRSGKASLSALPRWGMDMNGPKLQYADLPIVGAFQLMPQFALYAGTGVAVVDWKFESAMMAMPASAGMVIHPGARVDLGVEFRFDDITESAGRDSRWVSAWFALRR